MTDEFEDIIEGLDLSFPEDHRPLSEYGRYELLREFHDTRKRLYELAEILTPHSEEGIDLHARYHGLMQEMKKRGMK